MKPWSEFLRENQILTKSQKQNWSSIIRINPQARGTKVKRDLGRMMVIFSTRTTLTSTCGMVSITGKTHMHALTHTHTHTCTHTHTYTHMHSHIHTLSHTPTPTPTRTCTHSHLRLLKKLFVWPSDGGWEVLGICKLLLFSSEPEELGSFPNQIFFLNEMICHTIN